MTDQSDQPQQLVPNTFQCPNSLVDEQLGDMNGSDLKVYLIITRKTLGWHDRSTWVCYDTIKDIADLSRGAISGAIKRLNERDLIVCRDENGNRLDSPDERSEATRGDGRIFYSLTFHPKEQTNGAVHSSEQPARDSENKRENPHENGHSPDEEGENGAVQLSEQQGADAVHSDEQAVQLSEQTVHYSEPTKHTSDETQLDETHLASSADDSPNSSSGSNPSTESDPLGAFDDPSSNGTSSDPSSSNDEPDTDTENEASTEDDAFPAGSDLEKSGGSYNYPDPFETAWDEYPDRDGPNNKKAAYRKFRARITRDGYTVEELLNATRTYYDYCKDDNNLGTEYVKMAQTFFGPDEHVAEFLDMDREQFQETNCSSIQYGDNKAQTKKAIEQQPSLEEMAEARS